MLCTANERTFSAKIHFDDFCHESMHE